MGIKVTGKRFINIYKHTYCLYMISLIFMIFTAVGFGGLLSTVLLYPALYANSSNTPWDLAFTEMCLLLISFFLALIIQMGKDDRLKHQIAAGFLFAFASAQLVFFFYRLRELGLFYDLGLYTIRVGCRDITLNGNPIERYEYFRSAIYTKRDCTFNSFVETNMNGGNLSDWSDYRTYDMDLLGVARSAGSQEIEIPKYHHVWYWGCHKICTDRYDINRIWMYNSILLCIAYFAMATYYYVTRPEDKKSAKKSAISPAPFKLRLKI